MGIETGPSVSISTAVYYSAKETRKKCPQAMDRAFLDLTPSPLGERRYLNLSLFLSELNLLCPQAVERALLDLDSVSTGAVIVGGEEGDDKVLIAYVVPGKKIGGNRNQSFCVVREPLSQRGKTDRLVVDEQQSIIRIMFFFRDFFLGWVTDYCVSV